MNKGHEIKVLDHGYVKFVDSMGSDEAIVEAARMSTGRGFVSWDPYKRCRKCDQVSHWAGKIGCEHDWQDFPRGDLGLLDTMWRNGHSTPFEFGVLHIEVQAPIMVFREWHRHRTQCLAGDTEVWFELPQRTRKGQHAPYKLTMEELWRRWQPTTRSTRPERQTNALWSRSRVQGMQLRCLNEETGEYTTTKIVDVIRSEAKPIYRVQTVSGKEIRASKDHLFFTDAGWQRMWQFVDLPTEESPAWSARAQLTVGMTLRAKAKMWEPPAFDAAEEVWRSVIGWEGLYEVSNMGRVRRVLPGQGVRSLEPREGYASENGTGYLMISLSRGSKTFLYSVHTLVLEAFVGPRPFGGEARHADHNRLNPRLSNLSWGTAKENHEDMLVADRHKRLVSGHEAIVSVEWCGEEVTYDLAVEGPWHNFVAGGIVVHNSYSEFSARYSQMPDLHYLPALDRCQMQSKSNRQGSGEAMHPDDATRVVEKIGRQQGDIYEYYDELVTAGVAKEVARINTPVSRYSKMRATTDLRNWLAFLKLRLHPTAQYEIRQFAGAVAQIVEAVWPRTYALFVEHDRDAVKFSASDAALLRRILRDIPGAEAPAQDLAALLKKLGA